MPTGPLNDGTRLQAPAANIDWLPEPPEAARRPRSLGSTHFTLGGTSGERRRIAFMADKDPASPRGS